MPKNTFGARSCQNIEPQGHVCPGRLRRIRWPEARSGARLSGRPRKETRPSVSQIVRMAACSSDTSMSRVSLPCLLRSSRTAHYHPRVRLGQPSRADSRWASVVPVDYGRTAALRNDVFSWISSLRDVSVRSPGFSAWMGTERCVDA